MAGLVITGTSTENVHIVIPGATAMSEFQGYGDDCGPNAELMALHVCPWDASPLSANGLDSFRWQYVRAGRWNHGTALSDILWHLQERHAHIRPGGIPYADNPNFTALHSYIKQECLKQNPIIIQVQNASALSHNEPGVRSHFVTIAGIDSQLGYLTLNGDTTDALGGAHLIIPAYWNTWKQLLAARVCGAISLDRSAVSTSATPTAPVNGTLPADLIPSVSTEALAVVSVPTGTNSQPLPIPPPIGLSDAITAAQALVSALQKMQA